ALALHQQTEIAAHDVGVEHTVAHGQRGVEVLELGSQTLQKIAYEGQAGNGGEVVGELADFDLAHDRLSKGIRSCSRRTHLWGEGFFEVGSRIQVEFFRVGLLARHGTSYWASGLRLEGV